MRRELGLATLFSYRLSRATPRTFSLTANDYGFGLLSPTPLALTLGELGRLLAAGLIRMKASKSSPLSADRGETSVDLSPPQSGHATRNARGMTR